MLRVGSSKYQYSDLDELIVSHVRAMARKVDEMMMHDKYKGNEAELGTLQPICFISFVLDCLNRRPFLFFSLQIHFLRHFVWHISIGRRTLSL
jgi:hypothetical protein